MKRNDPKKQRKANDPEPRSKKHVTFDSGLEHKKRASRRRRRAELLRARKRRLDARPPAPPQPRTRKGMPGESVLDGRPSRVLNFPLTVSQQVWLMFLLPSVIESAVYILDVGTDVAIVAQLLAEGHLVGGLLSLAVLYLPPIATLVLRLCNRPPAPPPPQLAGLQGPKFSQRCANALASFVVETLSLVLFPLKPINCFGERVFWAIEAARLEDPEREEALREFEKTRGFAIESQLFLQAYLHAGPQTILQVVLIVLGVSSDDHTKLVQGVSVVTSLATLALVTANYQRYETQCQGGRRRVLSRQPAGGKGEAEGQEGADGAAAGLLAQGQVMVPVRLRWTRAMDEDNPLGKSAAFTFWLLISFGRILALVIAAKFLPWSVLGTLAGHYILFLLYILPSSPGGWSSVPLKMGLAFIYLVVLVEVGVQFRKAAILRTLFFVAVYLEDLILTVAWALWCEWAGFWYHYALAVAAAAHVLGLLVMLLYYSYFSPRTKRLRPPSQGIASDSEHDNPQL